MTSSPALTTHALSIGYPSRPPTILAQDLDLMLMPGEMVCLLGPNGVGKSTLLRTLAGLQVALGGSVNLGGLPLHRLTAKERARCLSLVLTERLPNMSMTGYELVALGRSPYTDWSGTLSSHDESVIAWAVQAVQAEDLAARPLHTLSDGQRQKLFIARALAQETPVILLDEPTAFLDVPRRVEMMRLLQQLVQTTGTAALLSTHDLEGALRAADRVWLLHEGALHIGAPEDIVLSGVLGAAFAGDGVRFDLEQGTFQYAATPTRTIALQGPSTMHMLWTRRALERIGWQVGESEMALHVIDNQWQLRQGDHITPYRTLYDLLAALRHEVRV